MLFTGKNNREYESPILLRRDELGMSMKELAEKAGTSQTNIYNLAYGMIWPVYVNTWQVRPYVLKLCDILSMDLEDMFPLFYCKKRAEKVVNEELFMSDYTLRISQDTEDAYYTKELYDKAIDSIRSMEFSQKNKGRALKMFIMYYEQEGTLDDLSKAFSLSRDRCRQILQTLMRRFFHPCCIGHKLRGEYGGINDRVDWGIYEYRGFKREFILNGLRYYILGRARCGNDAGYMVSRMNAEGSSEGREMWMQEAKVDAVLHG